MLTGQIKTKAADVICVMITRHQEARAKITDDTVRLFFNRNRKFELSRYKRVPTQMESSETYATYGSNFDINFRTRSYIVNRT